MQVKLLIFENVHLGGGKVSGFLSFVGSDPIITGIASLCGITGFLMTVWLAFKTSSINKTIKKINVAKSFNHNRRKFQKIFEGHRLSIVKDNDHSQEIISEIESMLQQYKYQFKAIFTWYDYWLIWKFGRMLKRNLLDIEFQTIASYLAELSGRLSKEEDSNIA